MSKSAAWSCVLVAFLSLACSDDDPGRAKNPNPGNTSIVDGGGDGATLPSDEISTVDISVGNFVFHARVAGPKSGEVVFLLHGFPQSSYEWRTPMRALARAGFRAIAPDQRGYSPGARPPAIADYAMVQLAGDITGMADAVSAERFHIVGHDWGSAVAWVVSGLVPDRVISLTAMSVPHPEAFKQVLSDKNSCQYKASSYFDIFTNPSATDALVADNFAGLRALYQDIDAGDVDVYIKEVGSRETVDAGLNWYRANVANRQVTGPELPSIKVPTLFMWSDGDVALCRDGADLTKNFVTGPYRFEIIPGASHWLVDTAAEAVTDLVVGHIGQYRTRD